MNDRFKFRVWDEKEKRFIDHPQINPLFGCVCGYENSTYPLQIEQCTGLKDKNGNLIYESDYVKDKDGDIYLVKWDAELVQFNATGKDDCGFETITPFMKGETEELEIIGNVHTRSEE